MLWEVHHLEKPFLHKTMALGGDGKGILCTDGEGTRPFFSRYTVMFDGAVSCFGKNECFQSSAMCFLCGHAILHSSKDHCICIYWQAFIETILT